MTAAIDIGPTYRDSVIKFLSNRIGTGTWGCRVEDDRVVLKVLPQWVNLVAHTLDKGGYIIKVFHPRRKTGVADIVVVARKPESHRRRHLIALPGGR